MKSTLLRWHRVPLARDPASVTVRDVDAEVAPESVGLTTADVDAIWRATERLYQTGLQPAISLTIRRGGQIVLRRSIGHARLQPGVDPAVAPLCTPDTPLCLFSASKSVTAMLVHKLAERRLLSLDDRVARYVPEYAAQGKGATTIRQLLAHRAGIPRVPPGTPPELVFDWAGTIALLCAARPTTTKGEVQSYHAITGGFVLGEVAQRVSGASLRELLAEVITRPMGLRTMSYGVPAAHRAQAALNYSTGPRVRFPLTRLVDHILSAPFERVVELSNTDAFFDAVIPAGNLYATADEAGAFYQMLLQGGCWNGETIFEPATVAEAIRPAGGLHLDRTLFVPVRFSAGFVLGEKPFGLFGRDCDEAYGHLGFLTTICWADPARDLSVGFVNTGKTISVDQIAPLTGLLGTISSRCGPLQRPA